MLLLNLLFNFYCIVSYTKVFIQMWHLHLCKSGIWISRSSFMLCQPQDLVWPVVLAPDVCNRPTVHAVRLLPYLLCFILHATSCWLTTCEIADKTKPRQKINLQLNCWNIIQNYLTAQVCISRGLGQWCGIPLVPCWHFQPFVQS